MNHCFKREVCAILIDKNGKIAVGQNLISNSEVSECPREKGENYEKCISICRQEGHAETMVIQNALERNMELKGSILYLIGHNRICDNCQAGCDKHGINVIIVDKEIK